MSLHIHSMCASLSRHIRVLVAPIHAYGMMKCSSRYALHVSAIWMYVPIHIDAIILVARVLYDINCRFLTELDDLSFFLHFVCASYEHHVYMFYDLHHAIFTGVQVLNFYEQCGDYHKHTK